MRSLRRWAKKSCAGDSRVDHICLSPSGPVREAEFKRILGGPFAAVSKPIFKSKHLFSAFVELYKSISTTFQILWIFSTSRIIFGNISAISSSFTEGRRSCKVSSKFHNIPFSQNFQIVGKALYTFTYQLSQANNWPHPTFSFGLWCSCLA